MEILGFVRNFEPLKILTAEQIEYIHRGTIQVLEETGVRILHERALKLLENNGCQVDYDQERVRIPPGLIQECLSKCPSGFMIRAREPKNNVVIGGNVAYFKNSCGMQTIDLDSGEPRVPTEKDNSDAITVLDYLENLHMLGPYTAYFGVEGVSPVMAIPESCAAKIRYSTKVQIEGYGNDSEIFQIQMLKAVGAEYMQQITGSAPLTWYRDGVEALFRAVEAGFPITIIPGQVLGGTSPATLAGSLAAHNAFIMAMLVLSQLIKPGTKVLPGIFDFAMDMKSGAPSFGSIVSTLMLAGFNQIWRGYGLPTYDVTTGYSSSKGMDFQAGYEKASQCILAGVSGANLMGLYGAVSAELTFHPVQAIMDDDLAGMVGRFLRGILVNEETLAADVINRVGPIPGQFLSEEHTRKWWPREQYPLKYGDRSAYSEWIATGRPTVINNAREAMEEILARHKPKPLTPSQEEEIERILEEAREYYRKRDMI